MSTPQPSYSVVMREKAFELRDYPPLVVAEVEVSGERAKAANDGFRLLAGYIFGDNTRAAGIAMTAPVTQSATPKERIAMTAPVLQSGDPSAWTVRFVMPTGSTLATLPRPNEPRVHLKATAAERYATVRFSGNVSNSDLVRRTRDLAGFVERQSLLVSGPYTLAQYDPPWTPWFMRRNEIWVSVAAGQVNAAAP